jgi:predicted dehydrogenase
LRFTILSMVAVALAIAACQKTNEELAKPVKLVTVDPGHFHAALIQKTSYPEIDSTVHVYAPAGPDLDLHLARINSYNTRAESPTNWNEVVHTGSNFFEEMISDKPGTVVVLSGNNQRKTEYILKSLQAGFNVFADKPMVIDQAGFESLKKAFDVAAKNKLLLYDIMTERFEISTILQRELSMLPEVFGSLEKGTEGNPAITKESVHHFYKFVSGSVLQRPAWFMDPHQQGSGIVDVTTHLVDLVQWEAYPEQIIDYTADVTLQKARMWETPMTQPEFQAITNLDAFPEYLREFVSSDAQEEVLMVPSNGEITYQLKGVFARVSVIWNYKAPEGTGDTHFSIMRGTKANLVIRQGKEENFVPTLYIEPVTKDSGFENMLAEQFKSVEAKYPGIAIEKTGAAWKINVPAKYNDGHEAHFARVTENFIKYLLNGNLPEWEVPNMLAKYYTTTQALQLASKTPIQ